MTTQPTLKSPYCNTEFANSLALLVLRLVLALIFICSGGGKLFGWFGGPGIENFSHYLVGMPILPPIVWAWMAALGEFLGGVSMLLGLLTRLGTIPLIVVMFVAIARVHGPNGFTGIPVKDVPGAVYPGYAFNVTIVAMALALLLAGPGLISLDALFFRRCCWSRGPQPLAP